MIRPATPDDVPAIQRLVHALAEYEREPDAVESTEQDLRAALFPAEGTPSTFAFVATSGEDVVGMAIWFVTYSTWTGRNGIWLEDLFVLREARGEGHGKALLVELARETQRRGYRRLDWSALDWNTPAIEFYHALGAQSLDEWTQLRLHGAPLAALAAATD